MDPNWIQKLSELTGIPLPQLSALAAQNPQQLAALAATVGMAPPTTASMGNNNELGGALQDVGGAGSAATPAMPPQPPAQPVPTSPSMLAAPGAPPANGPQLINGTPVPPQQGVANVPMPPGADAGQMIANQTTDKVVPVGVPATPTQPMQDPGLGTSLGAALSGVQAPQGPRPLYPPGAPQRGQPVNSAEQMAALAQLLGTLRPPQTSLAKAIG